MEEFQSTTISSDPNDDFNNKKKSKKEIKPLKNILMIWIERFNTQQYGAQYDSDGHRTFKELTFGNSQDFFHAP